MKNFKLSVSSFAVTVVALLTVSNVANAQGVNDFVFKSFDTNYVLTNDDPQGLLTITENIVIDYSGQNRGILRAIPKSYKDNDLNLKILNVTRDGAEEEFTTYEDTGNEVIRIGNASVYITGQHTYQIKYSFENVINFYDDYDELYWDINGDQWAQTFEKVSVLLDTDAPNDDFHTASCFTGSFGDITQNCTITENESGLLVQTTQSLRPNETLSIVKAFEKGYFTPMSWFEKYSGIVLSSPVVLLQLLAVRWAYKRWEMYGKDHDKRGVVAPYFERPKGVSVMQASYVMNNRLTPQHISANIIDLAIRGFIKIEETKDGRKTKHNLTLVKDIDATITKDEEKILSDLFSGMKLGDVVKLEDKKNKLYKTAQELANQIDTSTAEKGFYELSPKKAIKKIVGPIGLGVASLILGIIFANASDGISFGTGVVGMAIIVILAALMSKRSQEGNMLVEHMDGLKLYLGFSEKERLKMQDAVAAPLAPNSGQPTRDVKFFEKLLPYAVAAGVEKTWAKAFSDIYTQPPDWYQGNWSTFNTVALASSLSDTAKATGASFTAPSSSGSSGSGGGGFSGGGGGGGGGGGW